MQLTEQIDLLDGTKNSRDNSHEASTLFEEMSILAMTNREHP